MVFAGVTGCRLVVDEVNDVDFTKEETTDSSTKNNGNDTATERPSDSSDSYPTDTHTETVSEPDGGQDTVNDTETHPGQTDNPTDDSANDPTDDTDAPNDSQTHDTALHLDSDTAPVVDSDSSVDRDTGTVADSETGSESAWDAGDSVGDTGSGPDTSIRDTGVETSSEDTETSSDSATETDTVFDLDTNDTETIPATDTESAGDTSDDSEEDSETDTGTAQKLNACGGLEPLANQPGEDCGDCMAYECSGQNDTTCENQCDADMTCEGASDVCRNACGGTSPLTNQPGADCGDCTLYECDGPNNTTCENQCELGYYCEGSNDVCTEGVCDPYAVECMTTTTYHECGADGRWGTETSCAPDPACVINAVGDGACGGECATGTRRCENRDVEICENGSWTLDADCDYPDEICESNACVSNDEYAIGHKTLMATTSLGFSADTIYAIKVTSPRDVYIQSFGIRSQATGAQFKMAVYTDNDGPNTLVATSDTGFTANTIGSPDAEVAPSVYWTELNENTDYWVAVIFDNVVNVYYAMSPAEEHIELSVPSFDDDFPQTFPIASATSLSIIYNHFYLNVINR
jgi:hypothetical protein